MTELDSIRKKMRLGAIVLTIASAFLTFVFGLNTASNLYIALFVAAGLVVCSVASDYILLFVRRAYKDGDKAMAISLGAFAFLFVGLNLISNVGSVGWQRDAANMTANLSQAKFDDKAKLIEDNTAKRNLLLSERERLIKERGWTAMVPPASFDGRIAAARMAMEQEAARGGCKARCLERRKELATLEDDKRTAEELVKKDGQLQAIDDTLAKLKSQKADIEVVVSGADSQSLFFASLATASLDPSGVSKTWTGRAIAIFIAVFFVFGPIALNLIGWSDAGTKAVQRALDSMNHSSPEPSTPLASPGVSRGLIADKPVGIIAPAIKRLDGLVPFRNPETHEIIGRKIMPATA